MSITTTKNNIPNLASLLYISNIYEESPIYSSQVAELLVGYKTKLHVSSVFFSSKNEILNNDEIVIKKIPSSYTQFIAKIFFYIHYTKWRKFINQKNPAIIIGRGLEGSLCASYIKKHFCKETKLILDIRGDSLDEIKLNKGFLSKFYLKLIHNSLLFVLNESDHVFVVSSYLKNKLAAVFNQDHKKFSVFPTIVPEKKFFFSINNRENFRSKLNLKEHHILIVYSGSLSPWQNFDFILEAFNKSNNKNLKLLILSKEISEVKNRIQGLTKEKDILIYSVSYDNVTNYLQAGDYGLLIRDNIDTNLSASPTKFGEYINSGLTVILNKIKSDYVSQAETEKLNVLILHHKEELLETLNKLKPRNISKNYIPKKINIASTVIQKHFKVFHQISNI